MKIIIFGIGKIFNQYSHYVRMDDVQCFLDNSSSVWYRRIYGKMALPPERINEYECDYVVLFNQNQTNEMREQLVDLGIPDEKIISWQHYIFNFIFSLSAMTLNCYGVLWEFLEKLHVKTALDIENSLHTVCVGVGDRKLPDGLLVSNFTEENIVNGKMYDVAFMLDYFLNHSVSEAAKKIELLSEIVRYVFVSVPFAYPQNFTEWAQFDFCAFGKVKTVSFQTARLVVIDTKPYEKHQGLNVYVVTHKAFDCPKSDMYVPVWVGKESDNEMGIACDATGDSISCLNPLINECTAMYWIWKNTHSDFVGLCHYRRYFSNGFCDGAMGSFNLLDDEFIRRSLAECDMIVSKAAFFNPETVKEHLALTLCPDALQKGYNHVRDVLAQKHPDYLKDFDEFFDGHFIYPCNMFITSWEIFDSYSSWLFDIIIPAAKAVDVSSYDSYSKRVIGFMAERLLTLWILHNGIKVKEVPVLLVK